MNKYNSVMMQTAELFAKQSYCKRKQVGAVIAKNGRILVTGYNGTVNGTPNICEECQYICHKCGNDVTKQIKNNEFCECGERIAIYYPKFLYKSSHGTITEPTIEPKILDKTSEYTLHAEQNIITYAAKNGIPLKDTTMYITLSPCKQCAKLIIQSGISKVIYKNMYKDRDGIDFLRENGVDAERFINAL